MDQTQFTCEIAPTAFSRTSSNRNVPTWLRCLAPQFTAPARPGGPSDGVWGGGGPAGPGFRGADEDRQRRRDSGGDHVRMKISNFGEEYKVVTVSNVLRCDRESGFWCLFCRAPQAILGMDRVVSEVLIEPPHE